MKRQPADVLIGAGVAVVAMAIFGLLSGLAGMLELVGLFVADNPSLSTSTFA